MHKCKTKLVATLGPASSDYETIKQLADAGMDLARINMSHGTYEEHSKKIEIIERLQDEGYLVAIMTDLKGPKIRCGSFENDGVEFHEGDITRIVKEDLLGNKERFTTTYKGLYEDLSVGDKFTFDDGMLAFEVVDKEVEGEAIVCRALNNHFLKNRKGLNAPNIKLMNEYISDVDLRDIDYICKQNVNYIAASFVRRKEDLIELKNLLIERGREDIKIVAKIESPEGVNNMDEILDISNAVMVARGDLGVEVDLEDVPFIQKQLIKKCNIAGKPVIVATHMLESMQTSIRPTRAEVSDVFNAILDGADAVMLSGESASGKYPVESINVQARIAKKAEEILDYERFASDFYESSNKSQGDAIGISVSKSCLMLDAKVVVIISNSFTAARKLAKFKIKAPILSVVKDKKLAISLNGLYYGIESMYNEREQDMTYEEKERLAMDLAKQYGVEVGETIIFVSSNSKNNKSNAMKILQVE